MHGPSLSRLLGGFALHLLSHSTRDGDSTAQRPSPPIPPDREDGSRGSFPSAPGPPHLPSNLLPPLRTAAAAATSTSSAALQRKLAAPAAVDTVHPALFFDPRCCPAEKSALRNRAGETNRTGIVRRGVVSCNALRATFSVCLGQGTPKCALAGLCRICLLSCIFPIKC